MKYYNNIIKAKKKLKKSKKSTTLQDRQTKRIECSGITLFNIIICLCNIPIFKHYGMIINRIITVNNKSLRFLYHIFSIRDILSYWIKIAYRSIFIFWINTQTKCFLEQWEITVPRQLQRHEHFMFFFNTFQDLVYWIID